MIEALYSHTVSSDVLLQFDLFIYIDIFGETRKRN